MATVQADGGDQDGAAVDTGTGVEARLADERTLDDIRQQLERAALPLNMIAVD
eukprot:SAG22_NODE_1394_length_4512_cov_2.230455_1_plen_53_part_00